MVLDAFWVWLFSVAGREGSLSLEKGMMRAT